MHRILLVEDNEMNRDLISRRLKRRGFDVSLAVDGAEGVERDAVRCALEMRDAASGQEPDWPLRAGIDFGDVTAGVVGHLRVRFDLWGAPVTTASGVRRSAPAGAVHVSETLWRQVADHCDGQRLGEARVGGGSLTVYRVDRLRE